MYAAGTDMTKLRYTDTMQLNPLYRPQPDDGRWRQPVSYSSIPPGRPAAQQPINMSSYTPRGSYSSGKAQSIQQPSQGTPYGGGSNAAPPQPTFNSYGPGTAPEYMAQHPDTPLPAPGDPDWRPNSPRRRNRVPVASSVSQNAGIRYAPGSSTAGQGAGNLAYAQPDARPAPFTMQSYDLQGNPVSMQQQQQQRDAFLTRILQQPRSTPQYDFNGMLGEANDMVKGGWSNPFAGLFGGYKV